MMVRLQNAVNVSPVEIIGQAPDGISFIRGVSQQIRLIDLTSW